jgi:hypothetical protein
MDASHFKDENADTGQNPYKCESCKRKFVDAKDFQCHQQLWHSKPLSQMLLESMKPQKTCSKTLIPPNLNNKAVKKYNDIFGDHNCEDCDKVEAYDKEAQTRLEFLVCHKNYINLCDVLRYVTSLP